MDKVAKYRSFIKKILHRHAGPDSFPKEEYESQVVIDDEHGHYFLVGVGWENLRRIDGISIHVDLKGDKIWIQTDWTEPGVAELLEEMGVPKSDIVLGFHAPYRRKMIKEYAPG
ncbi:MAG: XisI protein [Bacteroidota bacterium]